MGKGHQRLAWLSVCGVKVPHRDSHPRAIQSSHLFF